jgi:hypothetical protein
LSFLVFDRVVYKLSEIGNRRAERLSQSGNMLPTRCDIEYQSTVVRNETSLHPG